jgi:threonylcarbamoyladenosine tRNA methylthiotransferase MtaB
VAKVKTITLGCRLNSYESEIAKGFIQNADEEIVIINTCAVTQEAERQSKQAVRKSIRENQDAKIIVTGCAAKTSREYFENLKGVAKVVQNEYKNDPDAFTSILDKSDSCEISNNNVLFEGKARAFIQIHTGCDNHCSICIVPYTRGPSKSLPLESILSQIKYFMESGFKEIVLSGVDISSYGKDLETNIELSDVLEEILKKFPRLQRIRISSIDPGAISEKFLEIISREKRIMPHLHLSVQSGDNNVLKMMRRRHTREKVINLCHKLRNFREDFVFGADFIAGFPGETPDMFKNTLNLVEEASISLLHVFPYSIRPGTLAASFLQLPKSVVIERAGELRKKSKEQKMKLFESFIGKNVNFMVEKTKNNTIFGKTDHFLPIVCDDHCDRAGDIVTGKTVTSFDEDNLKC